MKSSQYMESFIEESEEHIQNLNDMLLNLEDDMKNIEYINEMFRSAHTIKGMASTMGFEKISELTHSLENILDAARNGSIEIQIDVIDTLFKGIDILEHLFHQVLDGQDIAQYDIEPIREQLGEYLSSGKTSANVTINSALNIEGMIESYHIGVIQEALKKDIYPYHVNIRLNPECTMKSARAYIVFKELEGIGDIIASSPDIEDIERGQFSLEFSIIILTTVSADQIENTIDNISEIDSCQATALDMDKISQLSIQKEGRSQNVKRVDTQNRTTPASKNIRVDVARLDNLMNLVSELIIVKNAIEDTKGLNDQTVLAESVEYLQRVTNDLHEAVMQVRMIPIEIVFRRFPRLVRDLSRQLKKDIRLNVYGEDTEVDRAIVDEIGDPLVHLIRNSIDHGIETPDKRIAADKAGTGNIDLSAQHDGNSIVIKVRDDGRGIDVDQIKSNLISKSIITEEETARLNDREIVQYLFHPGFSTSEQVSNVSGRGVGLDVVKITVESLGGEVEIGTAEGIGTEFTIRLPLTLSIIQALLVDVGGEAYAIPLNNVREIVELSSEAIEVFNNREIISLRGELMPFIRLHDILDIPDNGMPKDMTVVIANKGDKPIALLIDSLIEQQDIVIKSLGKYLSGIDILSGATILGDGSLALILNINSIG
ncbi:MAG: chemotaxis protein CheA [Clostridiales bacterium]|nr:chemotaxis protein CheA [Clostridiales bacterium]